MKLEEFLIKELSPKKEGDLTKNFCSSPVYLHNRIRLVLIDYVVNEAVHGFAVVKSSGLNTDGYMYYEFEDDNGVQSFSKDIIKSDVYLHGNIKWDGCSDWLFDQGENSMSMLHFCGVDEACLIAEVMRKAYEIAGQQLEGFEG